MILGINEKRSSKKYPVKVCPFPGASANDMHHYLRPLLQKCPDTVILHVGTNNCVNESSRIVLDKILNLKTFIQNSLPQCKVIISNVINRKKKLYGPFLWMGFNCLKATATSRRQFTFYHSVPRNSWYSFYRPRKDERLSQPWNHDEASLKASLTVENLNNNLNSLKLDIVDNSTIGKECLGKKGLDLTKRGTGQLAINFIDKIRSLWRLADNFHPPNLASPVRVSLNDAVTSTPQNSQFKEQYENQNLGDGAEEILRHLKLKNMNRLVISHLNIKSLRNKFDSLKLVKDSFVMSLWYLKQS